MDRHLVPNINRSSKFNKRASTAEPQPYTMKPKPERTYPRWTVLYNIRTPGSNWVGKGVEFFDDEAPARARGREVEGTSRPFYPPHDRQYLNAVQGYAPPVSLTDYLKECA